MVLPGESRVHKVRNKGCPTAIGKSWWFGDLDGVLLQDSRNMMCDVARIAAQPS